MGNSALLYQTEW